jgi:hypothetical protein
VTVAPSTSGELRPLLFLAAILGVVAAFLTLPIVLLAGGPITGWALGLGLWLVNWGGQLLVTRVALGMPATAAVGVSGISFIARAWLIAIILFVVALRYSEEVGLTAAGVFLAAFTFDLMGRMLLFHTRERARREGLAE